MSRARWDDALDLQVHLHDQIRNSRLGYGEPTRDLDEDDPLRQLFTLRRKVADEFARKAIAQADPIYVSDEVFDLWRHASGHFRPEPLRDDEAFPTGTGLALFPHVVRIDDIPCQAVMWGHFDAGDELGGPSIMVAGFAQFGVVFERPRVSPTTWMLANWWQFPLGLEPHKYDAVLKSKTDVTRLWTAHDHATADGMWRELQSFWRLARQLVTAPEQPGRSSRRAAKRVQLEQKNITVIRLRRQRHEVPESERNVDWSCRWLVRGHWRQLADGRQTWVMPHVKGPDDKPFRQTDRVWEFVR